MTLPHTHPEAVRALLKREARKLGGQRALARELGISEQYLCDVLKGRSEPTPGMLEYLGLETTIRRRRVRTP